MSVRTYDAVDISKWVYQEPRKNPKNGLNVYVNEGPNTRDNPRFQLERCRAPFGIQDGMEEGSRKNLELAVSQPNLVAFATRVHDQNLDWVTSQCPKLFKKEMERSTVAELMRHPISQPSNEAYDPLMRIKINVTGRHKTKVYVLVEKDGKQFYREGDYSEVTENSEVLPIVEVGGLWFVSRGCGMTFIATDLLVYPSARRSKFDFALPDGMDVQKYDGPAEPMDIGNGPAPEASMVGGAAPSVAQSPAGAGAGEGAGFGFSDGAPEFGK